MSSNRSGPRFDADWIVALFWAVPAVVLACVYLVLALAMSPLLVPYVVIRRFRGRDTANTFAEVALTLLVVLICGYQGRHVAHGPRLVLLAPEVSREYVEGVPFPFIQATVHWCPADTTHRLHVMVGARGGPGWYVFVVRGCLGSVFGPFESEEAAAEFAGPTRLESAYGGRFSRSGSTGPDSSSGRG